MDVRQSGVGPRLDDVRDAAWNAWHQPVKIFNEFTQATYDTAMKFGGTGLGLTIARKLLALYGSAVRVDSVPGKGSTFSFSLRLPVARA